MGMVWNMMGMYLGARRFYDKSEYKYSRILARDLLPLTTLGRSPPSEDKMQANMDEVLSQDAFDSSSFDSQNAGRAELRPLRRFCGELDYS